MIREKELRGTLQKKPDNYNVLRVEAEKELWANKTVEEILGKFNK